MNTQTFDDGSSLSWSDDYGTVTSTDATDFPINRNASAWTPSAVTPGASSWDDVLKFGFSRVIDAKVRGLELQNAAPFLQATNAQQVNPLRAGLFGTGQGNTGLWLLLIGAAVFVALSGGGK